jgi:hypothetical protein
MSAARLISEKVDLTGQVTFVQPQWGEALALLDYLEGGQNAVTKWGVDKRFWPHTYAAINPSEGLRDARVFYTYNYLFHFRLWLLPPELWKGLLPQMVHRGAKKAVRDFQQFLNSSLREVQLALDGVIGPKTAAAARTFVKTFGADMSVAMIQADQWAKFYMRSQFRSRWFKTMAWVNSHADGRLTA